MFKSKLQELCQRQGWELPEYATAKDGPDHMPRFTGSVTVNSQLYETPAPCKSSKDAQNTAARVAFDHLTAPPPPPSSAPSPFDAILPVASQSQIQPLAITADPRPLPLSPFPSSLPDPPQLPLSPLPSSLPDPHPLPLSPFPSSLPDPPPGLLATKYNANTKSAKEELLQENCDVSSQCPIDNKIAIGSENKAIMHMYKNLLQQHAQKENIGFPVYTSEAEGPPHARRFKSKVSLNGKSYETSEFFPTLKEAEQTAAKMACQALSVDVIQEDKGLYKNLLQELAQKKGLMCPSYEIVSLGSSHKAMFVSTVEVGSDSFRGAQAKTKKQAEMNAAEVAYYALSKGCAPTNSLKVSSPNRCPIPDNLLQNIQPTATTEKHQVAIDEEIHAKRAKSSSENVDVNAHLHSNPPSHDTNLENSTSAESIPGLAAENKTVIGWKTVVFPRKANWPVPENATVMPYSDDQWVAYRIAVDQKPTA